MYNGIFFNFFSDMIYFIFQLHLRNASIYRQYNALYGTLSSAQKQNVHASYRKKNITYNF